MGGFEPFFDYDSLSEEMAADLKLVLSEYKQAQEDLLGAGGVIQQVNCAKRVVEAQNALMTTARAINDVIYTVPVIVHKAGRIRKETIDLEDGEKAYVQRCSKCASELHIASDRDLDAWQIGSAVAKTSKGSPMPTMYLIEDRELLAHEYECVSFKNIFKGG
jgi:hypothetical protein